MDGAWDLHEQFSLSSLDELIWNLALATCRERGEPGRARRSRHIGRDGREPCPICYDDAYDDVYESVTSLLALFGQATYIGGRQGLPPDLAIQHAIDVTEVWSSQAAALACTVTTLSDWRNSHEQLQADNVRPLVLVRGSSGTGGR